MSAESSSASVAPTHNDNKSRAGSAASEFRATPEELRAARLAEIKAKLAHLKDVPNRDVLESQWDQWLSVRKIHPPTRLDAAQRRQLLKFFQIMDADGGGTIDAEELVRAAGG
jgi:hypothetical protein